LSTALAGGRGRFNGGRSSNHLSVRLTRVGKIHRQGSGFHQLTNLSQVVEPMFDRSIGRWERYREQMKSVLPLLEPWAKRMGYEV
jgi:hypothetical protein